MTKQEFLYSLDDFLKNEIPAQEITDIIQYYERFIRTSVEEGQSEQEVLNQLGDPQLIAKTIIESNVASKDSNYKSGYSDSNNQSYYNNNQGDIYQGNQDKSFKNSSFNASLKKFLFVIVIILVILTILRLFIFLIPFIFISILVWTVLQLFLGNNRK